MQVESIHHQQSYSEMQSREFIQSRDVERKAIDPDVQLNSRNVVFTVVDQSNDKEGKNMGRLPQVVRSKNKTLSQQSNQ